jgi:hypothetical protein
MTAVRKRWWRAVAIAAVGGGVIAGGWFGLVRAKAQPEPLPAVPDGVWTRTTNPTPAPTVAEDRQSPAPAVSTVTVAPVSAVLPVPTPGTGSPVLPAVPVAPPGSVAVPAVPPIEPVGAGPRIPDAGLVGDKNTLPAVPAVPSLPPAELPVLPAPPKSPEVKPVVPPVAVPAPLTDMIPKPIATPPMPAIPPLPGATAEPPKAPAPLPPVAPAPGSPGVPPAPVLPYPMEVTPSLPPTKPTDPVQPVVPSLPDSGLKPTNPGNTLNPTPSPVAPAVPIAVPGGPGRETPGTPVDRPKPADSPFGPSDKFVFPLPAQIGLHPREDTMLRINTTAAFAFLGSALFAVEHAKAVPTFPVPAVPVPGSTVKADPTPEQLKKDLDEANKKIGELEKQVKKLTELLTGKLDDKGFRLESDPGAIEEIKKLRNRIAELETDLKNLKTQTVQRPPIVPDAPKVKGLVKVINEYPIDITIVINEKSYRVAPGNRLEVEVPVGDFTYQLLQSGAPPTKSVIKEKEPVTLRIK